MIREVNFPAFVAGLIDGVFNAIVTSSIKQMEAYGELVKNVAKSVDDFMKDNISENSARDYLADRYPDNLEVDMSGEKPQLKPKEGSDDAELPDFFKDLGLAEAGRFARRGHDRAGPRPRCPEADGDGSPAAPRDDGPDGDQPTRRDRRQHRRQLHVQSRHEGLRDAALRPGAGRGLAQ